MLFKVTKIFIVFSIFIGNANAQFRGASPTMPTFSIANPMGPSFSTSTSGSSGTGITFSMGEKLAKSENIEQLDLNKKTEKEVIVVPFNMDTLYHHSKTDVLIESTLESYLEDEKLELENKKFLKALITATDIKKFPSKLESDTKKMFNKHEIKQLKKILQSPFMLKFNREISNVENYFRNNLNELRTANVNNFDKRRMSAIRNILRIKKNNHMISDLKLKIRGYHIVYNNIRTRNNKQRNAMPKDILKKQIRSLKNNIGFLKIYERLFYASLSKLSTSELIEAERLHKSAVLSKFYFVRYMVFKRLLNKTHQNFKEILYASINLKSYKTKKDS